MTEAELIQGCLENDRKSQELLYKQYFHKMMSMCMKYTRDEDKAMLILNDGFLKVFQKIGSFRHEGSFEGWVRRLIYHTLADFYKKEKSYIRFIQIEEADQQSTPATQSDSLEFEELILLLDRIPYRSAEVFKLYAIEGFSHLEIGEKMQISVGTSKWHLSNAREKLRSILTSEYHERTTSI